MRWGSWLGLFFLAGTACEDGQSGGVLGLLEFRQMDFDSVALNEELQFYFSADLDRGSVTSDSVRILDSQGRVVAGRRSVRGNTLTFLPDLPCAPDLSDGGLRPDSEYRVVLGGFPRPDGIRSESGAVLSASLVLSFHTAKPGGSSPLFLDPFLGPFALRPLGKRSNPIELEDGVLVLEYGEALDPSSVPGCRFELSHFPPGATADLAREQRLQAPESIPVTVRLIENRRDRALLHLAPVGTAGAAEEHLPPDTYYLRMPGRELRTLGGRAVAPGWQLLTLVVPRKLLEIDFRSLRQRSNDPPPGCDGTAIWNDTGPGLRVRYPAAAGSGVAGEVELRDAPSVSDLETTRLAIAAESVVDLTDSSGPVVLRSQTSLDVRGRLVRRASGARRDPLAQDLERATQLPESRWASLSSWLERLLEPERPWSTEPWTVLIAGGDIRVPEGGAIEVDGPLVLVAGGWIRVESNVVSRGSLWHTPECGAMASHVRNAVLPLVLDPPQQNPLRTTLRLGAITPPLPWTPRPSGWRVGFIGHEGGGTFDTRFLQSPPAVPAERSVSDPAGLGAGPMRTLVRLELATGHGEPWDPPGLERLRLEALPGRLPAPTKP